MDIRRVTSFDAVLAAGHLFDGPPREDATRAFLADDRHHLLVAYVDGAPAGFASGVETIHPDKGVEMFLYELGVDDAFQRRGIGTALVGALVELARERGCTGAWTGTEKDNAAALATYRKSDAELDFDTVAVSWGF
ncbi:MULTISPECIES: GNAT family N-acetyltransferase [Saccharothrix]|uniref:GNAT family N-acetyltransferase n=2 Tax=Saccharothrix TaxID=2071 RepID=A0ABU0WXF3_9PSEU|nr:MULTISPECIES: GNAT family N-acetyltransferase [Saccharothrix]MDQ2584531.1 GNAT family N-acetyltransferase [Saccharothrix yanglingensis]MDR6597928.1 ribosomal protein S18 acetylase RimI-like enzyme [Saccharothrix longispora]